MAITARASTYLFLPKGGGLLFRYGGSIDSMLADTFPEIFQQTKGKALLSFYISVDVVLMRE